MSGDRVPRRFTGTGAGGFDRPPAVLIAVVVVVVLGVVIALGTGILGGAPAATNPIAATMDSINRGSTTYASSCAKCHGVDARGGGPDSGTTAAVPPALTGPSSHLTAHSDSGVFSFIHDGLAGGMPSWAGTLTDNQIWDVINFAEVSERRLGRACANRPDGVKRGDPVRARSPLQPVVFDGRNAYDRAWRRSVTASGGPSARRAPAGVGSESWLFSSAGHRRRLDWLPPRPSRGSGGGSRPPPVRVPPAPGQAGAESRRGWRPASRNRPVRGPGTPRRPRPGAASEPPGTRSGRRGVISHAAGTQRGARVEEHRALGDVARGVELVQPRT